MSTKPNLLVTGANGCIGSWVVKMAMDKGWRVTAFDLAPGPTRPRLLLSDEEISGLTWLTGDLTDTDQVEDAVTRSQADAIIHLGALQVPFCKADPIAGAQVNVVGTVNILEAIRRRGLKRLAFASSVAAVGGADPENPYLGTLYGAYKGATEEIARVYWQDWQVPSIVIRPGVVYGVGRDQGMTSAPTKAILAAIVGRPYTIPFAGQAGFLFAGSVASAFLKGVENDGEGCHIFDLNGECRALSDLIDLVKSEIPDAEIAATGDELPFPPEMSDRAIRDHLGEYGAVGLEEGVSRTLAAFRQLSAAGKLDLAQLDS